MSVEGFFEREYHIISVDRQQFQIDVRYSNLKIIGDGSYGFVCSADDSVSGKRVAIKKIADVFLNLTDAKRILRELKLLRHFDAHENVLNITDLMTSPPGTTNFRDVYIVTPLFETDLNWILSSRQQLSDQHYKYFLFQILRGLKFIHSANVLHRDLKPDNLLVNANCDLAICDFGLARGFEADNNEGLTEYVVTRYYRAPELLCGCTIYGKAVDVWSVGCIFAEMLTRRPFFQGRTPQDQLRLIINKLGIPDGTNLDFVENITARQTMLAFKENFNPAPFESFFKEGTNPLAIDLVHKMLAIDPSQRISVEDALHHEYLSDLLNHADLPECEDFFDFAFEEEYAEGEIPLSDLQVMIYEEMMVLQCSEEDDEIAGKLAKSMSL